MIPLNFDVYDILFMIVTCVIGLIVGVMYARMGGVSRRVLYLRERDHRGHEYKIDHEDDISVETRSSPELRFYKSDDGPSYEVSVGKSKITTFLCKEGTGWTWKLEEGDKNLEFETLEKAVIHKWGKDFYKTVPEKQKAKLRDNKMLVSVRLEKGLNPKGISKTVRETKIKEKAKQDMAQIIAEAAKEEQSTPMLDKIPWLGAGAALTFIMCLLLGWIKLAA